MKIIVTSENANVRLDKFLSIVDKDLSRNKVQSLIDNDKVFVNGKIEKSSYKVSEGDEIEYENDLINISTVNPENIDIDIVYEDDDLVVINKPKGMVVHPGNGNFEHTLANALVYHFDKLSSSNGTLRPGIVHRIDKDTAGLLIVAKNDKSHEFLSKQLETHTVSRKYFALVKGEINENSGKIIAPIGRDKTNRIKMAVDLINGKEAITHFKVLTRFVGYTLIECILETGRTHQIRVHMNYIGFPIVGDNVYGKNNCSIYDDGQLLFAHEISFIHPKNNEKMTFSVEMPSYFQEIINSLKIKK